MDTEITFDENKNKIKKITDKDYFVLEGLKDFYEKQGYATELEYGGSGYSTLTIKMGQDDRGAATYNPITDWFRTR